MERPKSKEMTKTLSALLPLLILLAAMFTVFLSAPMTHAETVTGTVTVGNNPWGVAYDSGAGEIFVANSGSGRTVSVISDSSSTVTATVTLPSGSTSLTGAAYDSAKGEVFVASQGGGTVSVICDGTNSACSGANTIVTTIGPTVSGLSCSTGTYPTCASLDVANGASYDPGAGEVFVTTGDCLNAGPGTSNICYVYVISDSSDTVTAAIPIGTQPGYATGMVYDPGAGELFVPVYNSGTVKVICDGTVVNSLCTGSSTTDTVVATITLPSGSSPEVIAYDSGMGELFVANEAGTVSVICDGTNSAACPTPNTLVTTISFANDLNPGIAYDSRTGEVFVSVLSYYVSVISDGSNTVTGTMYVGLGPYGIAYDSGKGETFAAVDDANDVEVISDPTLTPTPSSVSTGGSTTLSGSNYLSGSPLDDASCATSSGYVYCVGGYTGGSYLSSVYYAPVSSGGVGQWTSTTAYPISAFGPSCNISSGYIYCVGGYTGSSYSRAVYYASVSSSGVGSWTSTTAYPIGVELESCAVSSGYLFCVGGYTGSSYSSAVYYSQISSGGAGTWTSTSPYLSGVYGEACGTSGSYIYCVGGYTGSSYLSNVYYASVSSSGVGSWTSTTAYPTGIYVESCQIASGYMYCMAGYTGSAYTTAAYYSQVSGSGAGSWTSTTAYPTLVDREICATYSGYIYCEGGNYGGLLTRAVYYASVSSGGIGSWTSTTSYGARAYNYCFESGVTSSPTACSSSYQFTPNSSGNVPASTSLTVSGTTGLVVVSDAATGSVVSSAMETLSSDPTVAVTPAGPLTYDAGQTSSGLTATLTYSGPDTTPVEWYSSTGSTCSASSTNTGTSGLALTPSTSSAGTSYYCAVVSDSGVSGYAYASNAVKVTVDADPTVMVSPNGPLSYEVGQTASDLTATVTYTGPNSATVEWHSSTTSTCSASSADTGRSGTSFTPSTASAGTVYYCAVVSDSGVLGYASPSNAVEVTVKASSSTSVSCSPESVTAGSTTTCTATVSGLTPTGTVGWTSSSLTPSFSASSCTLSGGSCSVTYTDGTVGAPVITASYQGDSNNAASSGTTILANLQGTVAASSTPTTVVGGSASVNQAATTGVFTAISGSTAADGTSVSIFSAYLPSQPPGTGTVSLVNGVYYDVKVYGITTGTANVCVSNVAVDSAMEMEYYSGGSWVLATVTSRTVGNPGTLCGNIPVSALTGTFIIGGDPPSVPEFPFQFAIPLTFLVSVVAYLALRRRLVEGAGVDAAGSVSS